MVADEAQRRRSRWPARWLAAEQERQQEPGADSWLNETVHARPSMAAQVLVADPEGEAQHDAPQK